jgi:hypothetical protein
MNSLTPLPTDADIADARALLYGAPEAMQREAGEAIRTRSYRHGDMYCREVWRPARAIIAGKLHKRAHFYFVAQGSVLVFGPGSYVRYDAPAVIMSEPGTQRLVRAITDATCITVHNISDLPVDASLEAIEAALVEDGPPSLFGTGNTLKPPAIEGEAKELIG